MLARATRQLALGVGVGLTMAVALDLLSGGELMNGTGLLLVPGTAAFMLVVGLLAAAGPARRVSTYSRQKRCGLTSAGTALARLEHRERHEHA